MNGKTFNKRDLVKFEILIEEYVKKMCTAWHYELFCVMFIYSGERSGSV